MLTIQNKRKVKTLLSFYREFVTHPAISSAVIAGGAIRDIILDKPVTDIDIFINYDDKIKDSKHKNVQEWTNICAAKHLAYFDLLTTGVKLIQSNSVLYKYNKPDIADVLNMKYGVQLIKIESNAVNFVKQFNIGLCQAYLDADGIHMTADFVKDMKNNTLTIVRKNMTQHEFDYTMDHHIPKLKSKYPSHRVIVAPWNQQLEKKSKC